jgi:uncharacterized RDD family membrane protein YckC
VCGRVTIPAFEKARHDVAEFHHAHKGRGIMSGVAAQNRFAPPRAEVDDHHDVQAKMVDASRGARFLAILIDGLLPAAIGIGIAAAVAIPAYQNYKQAHVPGIEPPPLGSGNHMTMTWAYLAGLALLAFFVYSAVLVHRFGQTVGKRMMGIRVVRTDGSRVGFGRFIFLRWLPLFVVGFIPVIGFVSSLLDPLLIYRDTRQCLHDNIADTKVVTAASSVDATLSGDAKNAVANLRTISF